MCSYKSIPSSLAILGCSLLLHYLPTYLMHICRSFHYLEPSTDCLQPSHTSCFFVGKLKRDLPAFNSAAPYPSWAADRSSIIHNAAPLGACPVFSDRQAVRCSKGLIQPGFERSPPPLHCLPFESVPAVTGRLCHQRER
ncbi:uncharacterized protein BDZ83DRAFT_223983 [Colletotrichum acutatum]|uniref:Uncharacterized protein n=1 Tax=Glomerella acutata TaxID=27357 RepID=A0AAD8URU7_GLOAC|nr:uncharacterized protein BDZ83DRAFT_223983 [Colletotrichum acutatum]KAK1727250.1 hypothetical protein BDZ83DRAFT_223983 [Colletotrichum acutatum]